MNEKDSEQALNDLETRLKQARHTQDSKKPKGGTRLRGEASGFGQAMRIGAELISALVVGTGIGWFLDRWLDTKPWFMITFIFLGGAAGILNVYRVAMQMAADNSENEAVNGAKSGPSDGGDDKP